MVVQESTATGFRSIFESVSILSGSIFKSSGSIFRSSGSIFRSKLAVDSLVLLDCVTIGCVTARSNPVSDEWSIRRRLI